MSLVQPAQQHTGTIRVAERETAVVAALVVADVQCGWSCQLGGGGWFGSELDPGANTPLGSFSGHFQDILLCCCRQYQLPFQIIGKSARLCGQLQRPNLQTHSKLMAMYIYQVRVRLPTVPCVTTQQLRAVVVHSAPTWPNRLQLQENTT